MAGLLERAEFWIYFESILLPRGFADRLWGVWGINESKMALLYLVKATEKLLPFIENIKDIRRTELRGKFMGAV